MNVSHTNMNNSNIKFYISLEYYSISSLAFHFFFAHIFCRLLTKLGAVTAFYVVMIITCEEAKVLLNQLMDPLKKRTYSFLSNILDLWHQKRDHFHMFLIRQLHYRISSTYRMNYDVDRIHNHLDI